MAVISYDEVLRLTNQLDLEEQLRLLKALAEQVQRGVTEKKKHNIMELEGLGAEIWSEVDAQEYVNGERRSWNV